MSSNSAHIIHQLGCEYQELIEYVTSDQSRTAYEVELTLFKRLVALGAKLLYLFAHSIKKNHWRYPSAGKMRSGFVSLCFPTPGCLFDYRLLSPQLTLYVLPSVSRSRMAHWHGGRRGCLRTSGQRSDGTIRDALDQARCTGHSRLARSPHQ